VAPGYRDEFISMIYFKKAAWPGPLYFIDMPSLISTGSLLTEKARTSIFSEI